MPLELERVQLELNADGADQYHGTLQLGVAPATLDLAWRGRVERGGHLQLDAALPAMKAHGVPWLIRSLKGEIDLATAAEEGKRDTRRYTKRQATWFRHQLPDWTWVAPDMAVEEIGRRLAR